MACTCNFHPYILSPGEQAVLGCEPGSDQPCECVAVGAFDINSLTFYNNYYNTICGGTTTQNPNSNGTTTNNPSGNGSINYTYCYCPLSFCEIAALEIGNSFSGGAFGTGAIEGQNDTDATWNRNGNSWTASFTMPCGMSGTMTMTCDDATSQFNFSATSDCCDSMTVTPSSSSSKQVPPNFTASAPISSCNCPPGCCSLDDCGWNSNGTTTPNPNATTTINPNATTTQNPNNTTTNAPTITTTTENPNGGTTSAPQTTQVPCNPQTCAAQSGATLLCIDEPTNLGNCYWTLNQQASCVYPCTIDLNMLGDPCGQCGTYTVVPCSCNYS